ncbi:MAG: M56 family metallopeptidase [Rhodothermales bacterium]|nr:M56 family metallopeptidase [Rhodothermales bacterium]
MDNLLFSPAFTREAFVVLFDYALKGVIILLFANLLVYLLRPASAAILHAIWTVAMVLLILVPIAPRLVPGLDLAILDPRALPGVSGATGLAGENAPEDAVVAYWPSQGDSYGVLNRNVQEQAALEESMAAVRDKQGSGDAYIVRSPDAGYRIEPAAPIAPLLRTQTAMPVLDAVLLFGMTAGWSDWMLLVWLGGVVFLIGWMISGVVGLFWLRQRSTHLMGEDWQDLIDEISERYALRRPVALMTSGRIAMPMTWGVWRPVVMLPVDAEDWPAERRRSVLLHEVAHIARWDYLTQSLAYAVCAVNWFNPLVWRAAGQMRLEQEKACDDRVLSHGMKATAYASHLMDLARTVRSAFVSPSAAMSMARPSQLEGRLIAILDDRHDRRTPSWRRLVGTAAASFVLILPLAAMQVWRPTAETVSAKPARFSMLAPAPEYEKIAEDASLAALAELEAVHLNLEALEIANQELYFTLDISTDTTDEQRKAARRKAIVALRSALDDENEAIRRDAVIALYQIGGADAVDAFVEVVRNDPSADVRRQAVMALSRARGETAEQGLIAALSDADRDVRRDALIALSSREVTEATPAFEQALKDEDAMIRATAVRAMAAHPAEGTVDALADVLANDASRDVRIAAVQGLGMMRDIRAVDALSAALEDEDVDVRRLAAQALSQLNYGGDEQVRRTVGRAWGGVLAPGQIRSGAGPGTIFSSAEAPAVWGYSRGLNDSARVMAYSDDLARVGSQARDNEHIQLLNEKALWENERKREAIEQEMEALRGFIERSQTEGGGEQDSRELMKRLEALQIERDLSDSALEHRLRISRWPQAGETFTAAPGASQEELKEARISEMIRFIEEQPSGPRCKEYVKLLQDMKDSNPRAKIAVETLSCEKE